MLTHWCWHLALCGGRYLKINEESKAKDISDALAYMRVIFHRQNIVKTIRESLQAAENECESRREVSVTTGTGFGFGQPFRGPRIVRSSDHCDRWLMFTDCRWASKSADDSERQETYICRTRVRVEPQKIGKAQVRSACPTVPSS